MTDRKDTEVSEDRSDATQEQTEATASPSRRKLLRVLAGAGGVVATGALLPEKWTQPLVNRVLVPAHAQATALSYSGGSSAQIGGLGHRILNAVIPTANANGLLPINVCIDGAGATRTVRIFSCCDGGSGQSATLGVQNNTMNGPVGDCTVDAEFTGGVWVVVVRSDNDCPGGAFVAVDASANPAPSRLSRAVEAVIPAAHARPDPFSWNVTCGPSPCLGRPTDCPPFNGPVDRL